MPPGGVEIVAMCMSPFGDAACHQVGARIVVGCVSPVRSAGESESTLLCVPSEVDAACNQVGVRAIAA